MQPSSQLNDEQLEEYVRAAGKGDQAAFGELYDSLYERLYSYAHKRTYDQSASQDIVANAFYHIMTHFGSYRWHDSARFYGWIFRIMQNEISTYYRQQQRVVLREDWLEFDDPDERETQLEQVIHREQHARVHVAVSALSEKLAKVVELYYFAGLSHAEIAATIGISESAARVRLHRAIEQLHARLEGEEYEN